MVRGHDSNFDFIYIYFGILAVLSPHLQTREKERERGEDVLDRGLSQVTVTVQLCSCFTSSDNSDPTPAGPAGIGRNDLKGVLRFG